MAHTRFEECGEWLALLRFSSPSNSFNVMSLNVREQTCWAPAHVRGVPSVIAKELLSGLRFAWAIEAEHAAAWQQTSDLEH